MLPPIHDYDRLCREFRFEIPDRYNIGVDVCDRWAMREPDRAAIIHVRADGSIDTVSFGALMQMSNRLANGAACEGHRAGRPGRDPVAADPGGGGRAYRDLQASARSRWAIPNIRNGRARALAVTSLQRVATLPEMPTMAEAALPGYEAIGWFALLRRHRPRER